MKFLKKYGVIIWAIVLVSAYSLFLTKDSFLATLSLKTTDAFLQYRYEHVKIPKDIDDIVIIDIDTTSLAKLKQRWPITRNLYARLLNNISQPGTKPKVIVLNIAFIGPSELPENDLALAEALRNSGNVILGTYLGPKRKVALPESNLMDSAFGVGFVSYPRDQDFIIRRVRPFIIENEKTSYCLTLNTLMALKGWSPKDFIFDPKINKLKIEKFAIPIDLETYTARINYFAKFNDFKIIPFWKVVDNPELAGIFKDKIVLVGTSMELLHDIHATPLGIMPGLAVNANLLLSVLSNRFPASLPLPINFIIFVIAASAINLIIYRYGVIKGFILYLILIFSGYYISLSCIKKDIIFDFFGLNFIVLVSFVSTTLFKRLSIVIGDARLNKLAITDPLTGLYISRYFDLKLNNEVRIARESKLGLSLAIFEIDKFQELNTIYSYELGNDILREIASAVKKNSRPSDVVSRLVGTKFAVILTRTKPENSRLYAGKIRKIIEALQFNWQDKQIRVTVSAGVSSLGLNIVTPEDLLSSAIQALQMAIAHGPNTIKTLPA